MGYVAIRGGEQAIEEAANAMAGTLVDLKQAACVQIFGACIPILGHVSSLEVGLG